MPEMKNAARYRFLLLLLGLFPLTGCLFRSHTVKPPAMSTAELQSATTPELVSNLNALAHQITAMNATVDIASAVGGAKKGKVIEYQEIRGYILVRQPQMLRMIGLMPVVRTRAFDMVSNGREFKLSIPPKSKFYVGNNNQVAPGATGLTALRPQIIYDALLLNDIRPVDDIAVLEAGNQNVEDPKTKKNVLQPEYRLVVVHRGSQGWYLERKIYFNRVDLRPRRQVVYDDQGNISSDIRYGEWKQYGNIWFPSVIQINRPVEEYEITIGFVKLVFNEALTDQQFALVQPPGSQVIIVNGGMTAEDRAVLPQQQQQQQPR
jgi:outer membrane lipoprotein-sorting protein